MAKEETPVIQQNGQSCPKIKNNTLRTTSNFVTDKHHAAKLAKDKSLGASHIRVDLVAEGGKKKKFYSVNVTDLKAGSTKVNSTALGKGKSTRAFVT